MNNIIKYLCIVAVVFTVSVVLLPSSSAQRDNQSDQFGEPTVTDATKQQKSEELVSDEIVLPIDRQKQLKSSKIAVFVELTDAPTTQVYAAIMSDSSRSRDQKQAEARTATRLQADSIKQKQQQIAGRLTDSRIAAREIYRVQRALNGIAIEVDISKLEEIRRLPGVKSVTVIEPEYPTNATSTPFLGAPLVWGSSLNVGVNGMGVKGENIKIGIIDTGIDYQHAIFGGTGLLADYQANNRAVAPDAFFPSAKVVGGYDFAGDNYTGSAATVSPDNDPMDCNGHGTHVAGTAAGFGVNADGSTYTGAFNETVNYRPLRIGPGTAPLAKLYALRVFGCSGSTNLTVQAIDWSTDPNGDNDLSDHLDVINMSLGSNFGTISASSAAASDNAVLAGVAVVTSAGNAGDTYFISGAPGSGSRVLSTAASVDNGATAFVRMTISGVTNYFNATVATNFGSFPPPEGTTGNTILALDPNDAAGTSTTDGCSPLTNAADVAGKIAVIDRGTCDFAVKVKNAQNAGAIGVIIVTNSSAAIGIMAGEDPTITIPAVMVSLANGNTIKANIPASVTLYDGAGTLASFSSRGARGGGTSGLQLKPDITAPGQNITSALTGVTTAAGGFVPNSQALTISGTSMASPHVAGIMALLKQLHPDWTVEQLKALAMNGATHDLTTLPNGNGFRYGLGRIGAGRVDAVNSALLPVVAYNAEEVGTVSVTFSSEVAGSSSQTKKIRVVNYGTTAQTFDLGIDTVVDAPGVSFSIPGGNSMTIPPGQTVEFDVQMNADASQMKHTRELTVSGTQAAPGTLADLGNLNRHWLTEETSYITFNQNGNLKLRVPVYASPRAVSNMNAPPTIATGGAATGSTTIPLSGTDVCTGTLGAGPTCTGTFPNDEVSLVTPFELQIVSSRNTAIVGSTDIQNAGVAYSSASNLIMFGVSSWEAWASPNEVSFNIYVDADNNGTWDRILFNSNAGTAASYLFGNTASGQDTFTNYILNLATNSVSVGGAGLYVNRAGSAVIDSALFNNNVMFLAATPAQMGLAGGDTDFRYKIETCPGFAPLCGTFNGFRNDQAAGPYTWDYNAQGLNFNGANLTQDLNGSSIPVTWNTTNMTANGSLGALLLHHHNSARNTAEVVLLEGSPSADLALGYSFSPAAPNVGQNITLTLTATNNGPNAASGIVVSNRLPAGLTYVSDDSSGAYNSSNGQWTVGSLAVSGSTTIHIVATVKKSDESTVTAQITSGTPLDTNPGNNQARLSIMAPEQTDLGLMMNVSSPTVAAGNNVTYTLTVVNNGEDPAYSINVTESFPAFPALTASSHTASQGVFNPATGIWNLASLGKGNSAVLQFTVTAPVTDGPLTAQATVTSTTSDPNTTNNTASATTTVTTSADLSVIMTDSPDPVAAGSNLTYTITAINNGPNRALNVKVQDALPAQLSLVSVTQQSGPGFSCITGSNTFICSLPSFPAGAAAAFTVTAKVAADMQPGSLSNTVTVTSDTTDPNSANNVSTAITAVNTSADLTVVNIDTTDPVTAGSNLVYSIKVTNNGPSVASNVSFSDTLSDGTTFVAVSSEQGWNCTTPAVGATGTITCTRATLGLGDAFFAVEVKTSAGIVAGTFLRNTAAVSSATSDPQPNNNSSTAVTAVLLPGAISFDAGLYTVSESAGTQTVTVTRTGDSDGTITVNYATATGGSATGGAACGGTVDYINTSGTLTFAAGVTNRTFTITICNDSLIEATETLNLSLTNATNGATIGAQNTAVVSINDDEPAPIASVSNVRKPEGSSGTAALTFNVSLSAASTQTVTVNYATANGTAQAGVDYTAANGTLTFAPGEATKTVNVSVNGDTIKEPNETLFLNLSAPLNATIANPQATGIIIDEDRAYAGDTDRDLRTDFTVFRPSNGFWYTVQSSNGSTASSQFGTSTDIVTPGDFDNDGRMDLAYFRPSNGTWFIFQSSTGTAVQVQLGTTGDIPVQGDYDGDGDTDPAVFRPSTGTFYTSTNPATNYGAIQFGQSGDVPVQGDFDGDGKTDAAVYRNGTWFVQRSTLGFIGIQYGRGGDRPIVGDFDGDGKADFTVFRPSDGTFFSFQSLTNSSRATVFGTAEDLPVAGDYDGDGTTDISVWRPSNGTFYFIRSSNNSVGGQQWGQNNDIPVPNSY